MDDKVYSTISPTSLVSNPCTTFPSPDVNHRVEAFCCPLRPIDHGNGIQGLRISTLETGFPAPQPTGSVCGWGSTRKWTSLPFLALGFLTNSISCNLRRRSQRYILRQTNAPALLPFGTSPHMSSKDKLLSRCSIYA